MKRIVSLIVALILLLVIMDHGSSSAAEGINGHWDGALTRLGSAQPVSFDFNSDAAGNVTGTYDIPELGLFDEPFTDAHLDGNQLTLHFLYGRFALQFHPNVADLTGLNERWNPPVDLHLKRTLAVSTYRQEDVIVANGAVQLAGTLYRPLSEGPHPLLVMVPGSSERGRESFEYRGYGPLLAQQGIAAFVYDKRNVGKSSRTATKPTFSEYASDANAIVNALRKHGGVDPTRIGLGGTSQGGWIAPLAAATNGNVAFLVLCSGPAVSVQRQELDRVAATLRERNATSADIAMALKITQAYFDVGKGRAPLSDLQSDIAWLDLHKPAWSDVLTAPSPGESLQGAIDDWKQLDFDPAATLTKTRVPSLAFFGTLDDEVTAADNVPLMRRLLEANNLHNKIVVIEGANHALFMGQSLRGDEWHWPDQYWIWDRRAPVLIPDIVSWIRSL